jgi:ribonuclease D
MTAAFQLVDNLSDLESLGSQLSTEEVLAVDIEADSLHHYYPKVCLIQISTIENNFIVDPLAIGAIDPLHSLLTSREIKKVFHGSDYDLRSLFRDFATEVHNIFDTMVGSQFLGEKEPGLAAVLAKRFGVVLNKKYQKANWSKRPLSHDMLVYAARDTAHLIGLYRELERELDSKGRLSWVEEECHLLSIECAKSGEPRLSPRMAKGPNVGCGAMGNPTPPPPLFKRFRGAGTLTRRDLAILERLLAFREIKAMEQDRPPFKLFGNNLVKKLVEAKPTDYSTLRKLPGLPAGFMRRFAEGTIRAIKGGLSVSEDRLPSYPKAPRPPRNPAKQARLKRLKIWRDSKARQLDIAPGLISNNLLLDAVAQSNPRDENALNAIPGMKTWQKKTFGNEIIQVLDHA